MILEQAVLDVRPGRESEFERAFAEAKAIIAFGPGIRVVAAASRRREREPLSPARHVGAARGSHGRVPELRGLRGMEAPASRLLRPVPDGRALQPGHARPLKPRVDAVAPVCEGACVDEHDRALRSVTYGLFVELGRAPTASEVADAAGLAEADVVSGWQRLHEQHALVLDPATARSGWRIRSRPCRLRTGSRRTAAGGTRTAPGTHSASAPPCTCDGRIETVVPRLRRGPERRGARRSGPTTRASSSTASFPPPAGGTTSSSPEAR